ncbi:hypothetical protein NM688_g3155 [Phlebia brevispora]|uniref:Uncharacterized protein n=1 Tax=Phlebia brevispora TaxID=194682 RepID=A0ACC1T6H2_9APHY|nr:hypothetical protein NM688_g3155 [Phlebia brevispora]
MFEPVRGGTRGGQAEFKWSDVSQDKDRENYLGHSINAPTGRWQKNKDIHWYQREAHENEQEYLAEEVKRLKEQEAEALAAALGFATGKPGAPSATGGPATGSNAVAVPATSATSPNDAQRDPEKEERRRRKEEKRAKKEEKKRRRTEREEAEEAGHHRHRHRHHHHSRSRSPSPRRPSREHSSHRRPRSRTPPARASSAYDEVERERERERDRRRWADNARRERPGEGRWGGRD